MAKTEQEEGAKKPPATRLSAEVRRLANEVQKMRLETHRKITNEEFYTDLVDKGDFNERVSKLHDHLCIAIMGDHLQLAEAEKWECLQQFMNYVKNADNSALNVSHEGSDMENDWIDVQQGNDEDGVRTHYSIGQQTYWAMPLFGKYTDWALENMQSTTNWEQALREYHDGISSSIQTDKENDKLKEQIQELTARLAETEIQANLASDFEKRVKQLENEIEGNLAAIAEVKKAAASAQAELRDELKKATADAALNWSNAARIALVREMGEALTDQLKKKEIEQKEVDKWADQTNQATQWANYRENLKKGMKQMAEQTAQAKAVSELRQEVKEQKIEDTRRPAERMDTREPSPRLEVKKFGDAHWIDNLAAITDPTNLLKVSLRDYLRHQEGADLYKLLTTFEQPTKATVQTWAKWWITLNQAEIQQIKFLAQLFMTNYQHLWANIVLLNPTLLTMEAFLHHFNLMLNLTTRMKMKLPWVVTLRAVRDSCYTVKTVGQLRAQMLKLKPWAFDEEKGACQQKLWEITYTQTQLLDMASEKLVRSQSAAEVVSRHCPKGLDEKDYFDYFNDDTAEDLTMRTAGRGTTIPTPSPRAPPPPPPSRPLKRPKEEPKAEGFEQLRGQMLRQMTNKKRK